MNAKEILDDADARVDEWREHIRPAADFFHENEGELFTRAEAVRRLQDELDVSEAVAQDVLAELVGDTVDPVVQIPYNGERYVSVVEFHEFGGAYGYVDFDDVFGKRRRVICQKCVNEAEVDTDVTHATGGDPEGSFDKNASYDELVDGIHEHYDNSHNEMPSDVETGASLASGTTIGGNTAFHAGNDGSGSGIDADTVDGHDSSYFTTLTEVNNNADVPNADYADNAGDADTVDGKEASDLGMPIGKLDSAETFEESDVSVTGGAIYSESVAIGSENGTTASRGQDNSSGPEDYARGVVINPNTDLSGIRTTLSSSMGTVDTVFVATTGETVLSSKSGTFTAGDTVELNASLSSGTDYYVAVWNSGATYTQGSDSSPSFPYTSADVDIPTSCFGAHPDDSKSDGTIDSSVYCIESVTALTPKVDDSVTIEWPDPPDVYAWDRATFQSADNGGSIEVYIEESTDGGATWTEVAGPISRGDSIPSPADAEVRLRADLSRPSASDTSPTLDSVYRRYEV